MFSLNRSFTSCSVVLDGRFLKEILCSGGHRPNPPPPPKNKVRFQLYFQFLKPNHLKQQHFYLSEAGIQVQNGH